MKSSVPSDMRVSSQFREGAVRSSAACSADLAVRRVRFRPHMLDAFLVPAAAWLRRLRGAAVVAAVRRRAWHGAPALRMAALALQRLDHSCSGSCGGALNY